MYIQALRLLYPILKAKKLLTSLVFGSVLIMIGLDYLFNIWGGRWMTSLQQYDIGAIYTNLGLFTALALIYVFIYGLSSYWTRFLEFSGREILFDKYKNIWQDSNCTNPEQRLSEDCILFSQLALSLLKALLNTAVKIPLFLWVLFSMSSWWVALILLAYAVVGTILSRLVSKKLVSLEVNQQRVEAEFRKDITYAVDGKRTMPTLEFIKANWASLATANKKLSWFVQFYDQLGVIVPYLLLLSLYMKKIIDLGGLRRVCGAAQEVLTSLSLLVNSRDMLVQLQMVVIRLSELEKKNE
jgi:ABC-type uncharacterized transport system fused permease/ATPase subunit